tara:strand:- start:2064 stop:2939 length:876 start_codon:yes stop_codon:yes gene_type:complete
MSQIVYYRKLLFIIIASLSLQLEARLIKPSKNGEEKEVLMINGKRRLYFPLKDDGLEYSIKGPSRIEFISRYPVLRGKKKSHSFKYKILVDRDTINVNHRYKVQRAIKSVQHPKHKYTYSGNYFINLDDGAHTIRLLPIEGHKYPVLLRVITKDFESTGKNKTFLKPMVHKSAVKLNTEGKKIDYFECNPGIPLQIEAKGEKILRIITRLEFSEQMGQEESYRLRVREGKKIIGTYYFSTERSSASQIENRSDKVPGKWRSCELNVPKGKHRYDFEVLDKEKSVLTRFILY